MFCAAQFLFKDVCELLLQVVEQILLHDIPLMAILGIACCLFLRLHAYRRAHQGVLSEIVPTVFWMNKHLLWYPPITLHSYVVEF